MMEELEKIKEEYRRLSNLRSRLLGELEVLRRQLEEAKEEVKSLIGDTPIEEAIANLEDYVERRKEEVLAKLQEIGRILDGIARS